MKAFREARKVRLEHPTTDCGTYIYPRRLTLDEARQLRDELTRVLDMEPQECKCGHLHCPVCRARRAKTGRYGRQMP